MHKFGLIGDPIDHSQSPRLFSELCEGRWPYDLIEGSDFNVSWQRFLEDYDGINITAPFKEVALGRADVVSRECALVGAANIAVKDNGFVTVYNSDFLAVKNILAENGIEGRALVVGYGGAGRAAAAAASDYGMEVTVCNRTVSKKCGLRPLSDIPLLVPDSDIVIYTLPVLIPEIEGLAINCALEANYRMPVLSKMEIIRYISGLEWLKQQAVAGYPLLTSMILTK